MCNKSSYLLGHVRALCSGCRQAPQSRDLLAGRSSIAVIAIIVSAVEVVVVVVRRGVDEGLDLAVVILLYRYTAAGWRDLVDEGLEVVDQPLVTTT